MAELTGLEPAASGVTVIRLQADLADSKRFSPLLWLKKRLLTARGPKEGPMETKAHRLIGLGFREGKYGGLRGVLRSILWGSGGAS